MEMIGNEGTGALVYLPQEGRGIGLVEKIKAYRLQDEGMDTVEANLALGFRDDERDYAIAAHLIHSLAAVSIALMTNNPQQVDQLRQHGIDVAKRIPHLIPPNEHNRFYLETKAQRSGHWIDFKGKTHLPEQADPVLLEGMGDN